VGQKKAPLWLVGQGPEKKNRPPGLERSRGGLVDRKGPGSCTVKGNFGPVGNPGPGATKKKYTNFH